MSSPTLYYIQLSPPCRYVLLVSKMIDLEMDLKVVNVLQGEQMKPEFIEMNPQHCVPTLNDDGLILWESRAILSYLVSTYAKDDSLYPRDPRIRAVIDQRLMFDLGVLWQRISDYYFPTLFMGAPLDETKKAKLAEGLGWFDSMLKGRVFSACDQFTIADIPLLVNISQIEAFGFDLQPFSRVRKWYDKCKEHMEPFDYWEINGKQALTMAEMFKEKLNK